MYQYQPLAGSEREAYFRFFAGNPDIAPVGVICTRLDCTALYHDAKKRGDSFFLRYSHLALQAVNEIKNFKYRLSDRLDREEYIVCDSVDVGITVARADHSFGFAYLPYREDYQEYAALGQVVIEQCKGETGLKPSAAKDLIYLTVTPLLDFTSLSFSRSPVVDIPRLAFGKVVEKDGRREMALAIQYHHGFQDGHHVGLLATRIQALLDQAGR